MLVLIVGLVVAYTQLSFPPSAQWRSRHHAAAAIQALQRADLPTLEQQLSAHRGQPDFAYYFTSQTTPRLLGDALASVAGTSAAAPLKTGIDSHAYDLELTDLAGTIALATHGTGDRALPLSWTNYFVEATTEPAKLYPEDKNPSDAAAKQRSDQDTANRQNLLLLLSRGYWSANFLETATEAYWDFDHAHDDNGWPGGTLSDAKYAPSPSGAYLTDGMLAIAAALTANPDASEWAFADFQPGTVKVSYDGADHPVGTFTHYLFFEHHFPTTSDGDSVGMTATLTALSSAIDASGVTTPAADAGSAGNPVSDSQVLQGLAKSLHEGSGCSWNPLDYGHCVVAVAKDLWHWVQHWGHSVLDILSLATFAPPPIDAVGIGAAATNATWYTVQGDYADAGLSLAAAVPGLAFTKIAKVAKVGVDAADGAKAVAAADKVASYEEEVARAQKVWEDGAREGRSIAVRAMTYGRRMHELQEYGPGFEKEFTLPSGRRVDAINFDSGVVKELKPDSASSIKAGEKQLQEYLDELNKEYPRDPPWTGSVVTYARPVGGS